MDRSLCTFLFDHYLRRVARLVNGTEAFGFETKEQEGRTHLTLVLHIRPGSNDPHVRKDAAEAAEKLVRPCIARGVDEAIQTYGEEPEQQYCLVRLLYEVAPVEQLRAVVAIIARCSDKKDAMTRLEKLRTLI